MNCSRILSALSWLLFLFYLSNSLAAPSQPKIGSLAQGIPKNAVGALDPSFYEPVKAYRLRNASVVWVNFQWLKEHGIEIPANRELTPKLESEILDAFAYQVPHPKDSRKSFLPKFKTWWADRYGGLGINFNWGSGRAAARGVVQAKGIGTTSMVNLEHTDIWHSDGAATVPEGIQEASWGEILNQELPYGANRVIAIIQTGTFNKDRIPRALLIREDPLRPAHALLNDDAVGEHQIKDAKRVHAVMKKITEFLPVPPEAASRSKAEQITAGINEYIDRVADQNAAAFARRYYHGATTPSNGEIDAKFNDFGNQTALPNFAPYQILEDDGPFGDIRIINRDQVSPLVEGLARTLPPHLSNAVPTPQEAQARLEGRFLRSQRREILLLTGVPPEILDRISNDPQASALADTLITMSKAGHPDVVHSPPHLELAETHAKYDLGKILQNLAGKKDVSHEIPEASIRAKLGRQYSRFINDVQVNAARMGITREHLQKYMELSAEIKNADQPELYFGPAKWVKAAEVMDEVEKTGNPNLSQQFVDDLVARNIRTFRDVKPFQIVLSQKTDPKTHETLREIYDAKTGERSTFKPAEELSCIERALSSALR